MDLLKHILHDVMDDLRRENARDLQREAEAFLESLNPDSQEGLWFDALAESYPTRLDAALAYVRDVKRRSS